MNNVCEVINLSFNENFNVVYKKGSSVPRDENAESYVHYVFRDISDIRSNYIKLGYHLDEIKRCGYYSSLGYDDFYDFCLSNFDLKKSAVSRCMSVFYRFAECDNYVRKMWLDKKYEKYSYSQLCEMVSCRNDSELQMIKPDMTIKEIRELKKNKFKLKVDEPVATSQPVIENSVINCSTRESLVSMIRILLLSLDKKFDNVYCILGDQPKNPREIYINVRESSGSLKAGKYKLVLEKIMG